jgi:hypothetical protein
MAEAACVRREAVAETAAAEAVKTAAAAAMKTAPAAVKTSASATSARPCERQRARGQQECRRDRCLPCCVE